VGGSVLSTDTSVFWASSVSFSSGGDGSGFTTGASCIPGGTKMGGASDGAWEGPAGA